MSTLNLINELEFKLTSLDTDGNELEHVMQEPSFYLLQDCMGNVLGYFTTISAAHAWINDVLLMKGN